MEHPAKEDSLVLIERPVEGVLLLRMNRHSKRNAISNKMLAELADAVRNAETTRGTRCIVLSGFEDVFSAGADIKEMRAEGIDAIHNRSRCADWNVLQSTPLPIIAAVSGLCLGGGHELALLCDVVIGSETTQIGQPEIKLGHIPGDGSTQRLIRLTGKYAAMKLILSGEPIDATEALRLGLLAEVVPVAECLPRALELAQLIARHSSVALGLAKDAVLSAHEVGLSQGLGIERRNLAKAFTSVDQKEGLAAFFDKRPPNFIDQ